jgi:hypothetical protein
LYSTHIAGLQYYDYDSLFEESLYLDEGDRLNLVREPHNEKDKNAIQVYWRNKTKLGYIPRYEAEHIAPLMDTGLSVRAYVYYFKPHRNVEIILAGNGINFLADEQEKEHRKREMERDQLTHKFTQEEYYEDIPF